MAGRPINRLTAREVTTLKAPGLHADGGGLYLFIGPEKKDQPQAKRWTFVYFIRKARREMGLGSTGEVTLAEARDLRDAARKAVAAGLDPAEERRREREAPPEVPRFGPFAKEVVAGLTLKSPKHRAQWERTLTDYAPGLQQIAVDRVTAADIVAALKPRWTKTHETAERMRGRMERVLDAARAAGHISGPWENPARWKGHMALLLPRPKVTVRHHPAMAYADLPAFMLALRARPGIGARALEWAILTAARTEETRFVTWAEIVGDVWTVPAARMKKGREHRVPLTAEALAVLDRVRPPPSARRPGWERQFIFLNRKGGALSNMTMDKILRLDDLEVTVHGFRSTFRDWAGDGTDFPREVIEAALAHLVGDQTEAAYRRGDALEKRRLLMEAWAAYCSKVVAAG